MTTPQTQQQDDPFVAALRQMQPEIAKALPAHIGPERFARIVTTEARKNPKLLNTSPHSFFGALLTAASLGLEPGLNGEAYILPYGNEAQLIIGYQGLVKLFWQHPLAKRLSSEVVYEKDEFHYTKGLEMTLTHKPFVGKDRGAVVGYYAIAELNTGALVFDFFTPEEIRELRGGKTGPSGKIADPQQWMERKTAMKQVLKLMPKSTELAASLRVDETISPLPDGVELPKLEYPKENNK